MPVCGRDVWNMRGFDDSTVWKTAMPLLVLSWNASDAPNSSLRTSCWQRYVQPYGLIPTLDWHVAKMCVNVTRYPKLAFELPAEPCGRNPLMPNTSWKSSTPFRLIGPVLKLVKLVKAGCDSCTFHGEKKDPITHALTPCVDEGVIESVEYELLLKLVMLYVVHPALIVSVSSVLGGE